jgi:hypothetical protein
MFGDHIEDILLISQPNVKIKNWRLLLYIRTLFKFESPRNKQFFSTSFLDLKYLIQGPPMHQGGGPMQQGPPRYPNQQWNGMRPNGPPRPGLPQGPGGQRPPMVNRSAPVLGNLLNCQSF